MDTFLVTYRYFTTGKFVLQSLVRFYEQLEEERTGKRKVVQNSQDDVSKDNNHNERKISKWHCDLCFYLQKNTDPWPNIWI